MQYWKIGEFAQGYANASIYMKAMPQMDKIDAQEKLINPDGGYIQGSYAGDLRSMTEN